MSKTEFRVAATFNEARVASCVRFTKKGAVRAVIEYLKDNATQVIVREVVRYQGVGLNHKPQTMD